MLSEPHAGWATIQINDWHGPVSYIDDVPNILLGTLASALLTGRPAAINIDAENVSYILVFDVFQSYAIEETTEDGQPKLTVLDVDLTSLAKELLQDITANIDQWVEFVPYDLTEEERQERRIELLESCGTLNDMCSRLPPIK